MIVNFNPSVSNKMNTPKLAKNNNPNVAFKRNFNAKEIEGMAKSQDNILNNVIVGIRFGAIRAADGAKETLAKLMQQHPDNKMLSVVYSKFP